MEHLCPCFWGKRIQQDCLLYPSFFLLAIFQSFDIMRMKNKICGSFRGVGAPKACAGDYPTYTTAYGRTAWTILYSFSPGNARFSLAGPARNAVFYCTHFWCFPSGSVCIGILPETCRVGTQDLHGIFVFPRPPRGELGSPRVSAGERGY